MSANEPALLAHHFENLEQQQDANNLGMWMFLSTEIMFFGGIFGAYAMCRSRFFDGFVTGSELLNVTLGAVNTAILIGSSLTMAMAVRAAQTGKPALLDVRGWIIATIVLGVAFLGVKYFEWKADYHEGLIPIGSMWHPQHAVHELDERHRAAGLLPPAPKEPDAPSTGHASHGKSDDHRINGMKIFYSLYFGMTGMHALHMLIGFAIMGVLIYYASPGVYNPKYYGPIEVTGLYWHFVDIVWIFLFPLLYLIRQ